MRGLSCGRRADGRFSSLVGVAAALATVAVTVGVPATPTAAAGAGQADSVVLRWNTAALQGVRESGLGPPAVARALAVMHTCMYDAWAAYDDTALGTRYGGWLRRPPRDRTLTNAVTAVNYAAYRAAVDVFPRSRAGVFDPLAAELGVNPAMTTTDVATPAGLGNAACAAVLAYRHGDGSNQLGNEPGGAAGVAYADYTGYRPVNEPLVISEGFDPDAVHDPSRWQPLIYVDPTGTLATPSYTTPFWGRVEPFALRSGRQLRSRKGPATYGTAAFKAQARELARISAGLTDRQKAIAEYWADGPRSEAPPGHWNLFAQYVSRRDRHGVGKIGLEKDVKLFFALTNAVFDAGIVAWDNKGAFDSARPITAIRSLFRGKPILAWAGPYRGTELISGEWWLPYQRATFPTPPFPEYTSGHSTFSAAAARILQLATGSDRFGASVTMTAGSSTVEPGAVPAADVVLRWPTFSAAAEQAGLSRRYGGIHFERADLDGRSMGRTVGSLVWQKAQSYFRDGR